MIGTSELLRRVDIPRNKLYYLEQKGYIQPFKKRVGEKEYRLYSEQEVEKVRAIWEHLKQGLRYRVAYERGLGDLKNLRLNFGGQAGGHP